MAFRATFPALALVVLLAGCGGAPSVSDPTTSIPTATPEPARYADEFNLVPPASREVNFRMETGASVHVEFNATYAVTWDLHSHSGDRVDTWENGTGREVTLDFAAPASGVYSVWIRATGPITTKVVYEMTGAFTLVG